MHLFESVSGRGTTFHDGLTENAGQAVSSHEGLY